MSKTNVAHNLIDTNYLELWDHSNTSENYEAEAYKIKIDGIK